MPAPGKLLLSAVFRRHLARPWLILAVGGVVEVLSGAAQFGPLARGQTSGHAPSVDSRNRALSRFIGVLPCADCSGIRFELRLYTERPSGRPTDYESTETYLGTHDGDRTVQRSGRWTIMRGSAADRDTIVYQLSFDRAADRRNFLRVKDAELRLLDRNQREISSTAPHSLYRVTIGQSVEPITLAEDASGRVVDVSRGQIVAVRLRSNHSTGYRWTLPSVSEDVLIQVGEPVYTPAGEPNGRVGRGDVEVWLFIARQRGRQQLQFEYRRPWQRDAAAARILVYTIVVG